MNVSRAIFGIGNKGEQYKNTRHNLGWMVLDELSEKFKVSFQKDKKFIAFQYFLHGHCGYFVKLNTFVNLSGSFLSQFVREKQIDPQNILVICDDIHLDFGRIKIRPSGQHGGHNGLRSIISELKTSAFPRLRVGIGEDQFDRISHVLGEFSLEEKKNLPDLLSFCREVVEDFFLLDWSALMSRHNGRKIWTKNDDLQ